MLTEEEMFPEKARHRELVGLLADIRDALVASTGKRLTSPQTGLRASESDAGPSKGSPEAPPAPERPREGESDEALANALLLASEASRGLDGRWVDVDWHAIARAAREHLAAERAPKWADLFGIDPTWTEEDDPCICAACQPDYRLMRVCATCGYKRCPGAADHRNTCTGSNEPGQPGSLYADPPTDQERLGRERNGWQAKHEALRADVTEESRHWHHEFMRSRDPLTKRATVREAATVRLDEILDRDDDRDPQPEPDADTVTLRREDVEVVLEHGVLSPTQRADAVRRVRAALGWGDSDDA